MEYTKDLVLNLRADARRERETNKVWTSLFFGRALEKVKRHKIITMTVVSATLLITLDAVLLVNFINVLGSL